MLLAGRPVVNSSFWQKLAQTECPFPCCILYCVTVDFFPLVKGSVVWWLVCFPVQKQHTQGNLKIDTFRNQPFFLLKIIFDYNNYYNDNNHHPKEMDIVTHLHLLCRQVMPIPSAKAGAVPEVFNRILPAFELNQGEKPPLCHRSPFNPTPAAELFLSYVAVDCFNSQEAAI